MLWLNNEGSNKFVTKDNAAPLWTPYTNFIHEIGFEEAQITALIAFLEGYLRGTFLFLLQLFKGAKCKDSGHRATQHASYP